jgi:hypothetical protein
VAIGAANPFLEFPRLSYFLSNIVWAAHCYHVLFASPVEWIQELRGELAGQSDHIWPHACSADMREVLEAAPGADRLDYKIAEEMWRRGAKWAYHNTDKLFSIPKHPAPISS